MDRKFTDRNESFVCVNCKTVVQPSSKSCRNHCPNCLHSVHLDVNPGDRKANCGGVMVPIAVDYNSKKGYQIVHECTLCGHIQRNIAALDDALQPDSLEEILRLMVHGGGRR